MATMPGELVEGPYDPTTDKIKAREPEPYKPDMGAQPIIPRDDKQPANPYASFLNEAPAVGVTETDPGFVDRWVAHLTNASRYAEKGLYDLGAIRDANQGYGAFPGYEQTPEDRQNNADYLRYSRQEDLAQFEGMKPAHDLPGYIAAVSGELVGSAGPSMLLAPEVKIGTAGYRAAYPMVSRVLETGVSQAAVNLGIDAGIQTKEKAEGVRDQFDLKQLALDAGLGFAFGTPFGYVNGLRAKAQYEFEALMDRLQNAPAPGKAPPAPGFPTKKKAKVDKPVDVAPEEAAGNATPESLMQNHGREALDRAQTELYGEVIGTREMTPEQLNAVDDHLNGGKAGEIPQGKIETKGSAGPDLQVTEGVKPELIKSPKADAPLPLGREYQVFTPDELKTDAKRFQYKGGGDEQGVTGLLKGVKKWDQRKAGLISVWESKEGERFVFNGHQRLGLAKRAAANGQEPKLLAQVYREVDGISAEDAMIIGAELNMGEGSGTALDAAKILRVRPSAGDNLPTSTALMRDAKGLAALSDDAFGMVVNEKVPQGYAAIVGRLAPDKATHAELLGLLAKTEPESAIEAESIVRDSLEAPAVTSTMTDMFGSAQVTQILFKERAQILSAAASAIKKDRSAFSTLVREEGRLSGAGNKLATKSNEERASLDAELLANLQASARRKGPIADALAKGAKDLKDGKPRKDVIRDFLDSLRGEVAATRKNGGRSGAPGRTDEIAASLGGYRNTEQPAFKRWFGESKVVDADGEPMVLYHSTDAAGFEKFKRSRSDVGMHFGTAGQAEDRFDLKFNADPYGAQLRGAAHATMPVYLSIKRPLRLKDAGAWNPDNLTGALLEAIPSLKLADVQRLKTPADIRKLLMSHGYDGIVYKNTGETGGGPELRKAADQARNEMMLEFPPGKSSFAPEDQKRPAYVKYKEAQKAYEDFRNKNAEDSYIAFEPTQIKSIFNRGTWDAAEPNIAFSKAPKVDPRLEKTKVVDANGKPRVMYHGTDQDFEVFRPSGESKTGPLTSGEGIYFTDSKDLADAYASKNAYGKHGTGGVGANIRPVYLNIENPYVIKAPSFWEKLRAKLRGKVAEHEMQRDLTRQSAYFTKAEVAKFKADGYDGVINEAADEVIVFDESQIISKFDEGIVFSKGASLFDYEPGAEGKAQAVIPGTERAPQKTMLERQAAAPMRAGKTQKDMDFGLFGSERDQLDLVDLSRIAPMVRHDADYVDLSPSGTSRSITLGDSSITYGVKEGEVEILSVRTPPQLRGQGAAREAMVAFLEKADDAGLAVRTVANSLDRTTQASGVVRFYESLGFTATGKSNSRGALEMLRAGPPPDVAELRNLVGSGHLVPLQDYRESGMARTVANAWYGNQPQRTFDDIYGGRAQKWQDQLERVGRDIEDAIGIEFGNPGIKARKVAEEKIGRKGYKSTKQVTDIVRGGFTAESPDQVQRAINMLAQHFYIIDEGWNLSDVSYFDRKVGVKFRDGTIGEIQFWQPDLLAAKKKAGHKLYEEARSLPQGDPKRGELENQQRELYEGVISELSSDWLSAIGRSGSSGNVIENASLRAASESSGLPESITSAESTGLQSSPGSRTAQAEPTSTTAGRSSQSKNRMADNMAFASQAQPQSAIPVNRPQMGTPTRPVPRGERLEAIGADLAAITGAPVRQGRLARSKGPGKTMGQYDRSQGVIRLRVASDFDVQSHETAHSLETEYGRTLAALKGVHAAELEPLAYAGADPTQKLSEGFAEWFRFYVTTPNYARRAAPTFTAAFEAMLDPKQLKAIRDVSQRYTQWTLNPSGAAIAGDVTSARRGGKIMEALKTGQRDGWRPTLAHWADQIYADSLDSLHPLNVFTDEASKIHEKNTGRALNLTTAHDPYRLARLFPQAYAAGHIDFMHGVVPYLGTAPEGASMSDAIGLALGDQVIGWDDALMADFASYLISRRALHEYDRFLAGEIPNPPGKFTRGDYEVAKTELEAANPHWVKAAAMVYEWGKNMLRKKYEAGFITKELYEKLMLNEDFVPFMRDLTDLDREAGATGNMTLRNSILKAFKGSKRSIINPLESMLADAYHFNAVMKRNDIVNAMDAISKEAGPGSGKLFEHIPSHQLTPTKVDAIEAVRAAGKANGMNPNDLDTLTFDVEAALGSNTEGNIFRSGDINEKGEPIVYSWRDGKKQTFRLADGEFGMEMYEALTNMSKEQSDWLINLATIPTQILRYGITTHPVFLAANIIRDQASAWILSGGRYIPFVDNLFGMGHELLQTERTQQYNIAGGVVGGGNVATLERGWQKKDINAMNKSGVRWKRFANWDGFAQLTNVSETGTRLGLFQRAVNRARREGLSEYEAMVEGAYQATDYFDWGRHGSRTKSARRLVTFLNSSLQGLNKAFRVGTAEGAFTKAVLPYFKLKAKRPLSARDKANMGTAIRAWTAASALGVAAGSLTMLYRGDPEYQEIPERIRATHYAFRDEGGTWRLMPKAYETGIVSNLFERAVEKVYNHDPEAMTEFRDSIYTVTAPPMQIPVVDEYYNLRDNVDENGVPVVSKKLQGLEPWAQYNSNTSETAKAIGKLLNISPLKVSHAINGFGGSWGKTIQDTSSDIVKGQSPFDAVTTSFSRRFMWDFTKGSESTDKFWSLVSDSNGKMANTAKTYSDFFKDGGQADADKVLVGKDDNTKAYALLLTHFDADVKRLHPLYRAKEVIGLVNQMNRDIIDNDLRAIETDKEPAEDQIKIDIPQSLREPVHKLLSKLSAYEARNALKTIETPRWAELDYGDTESLRAELRALSPEVADELEARMEAKTIYDDQAVRESWPEVKSRVLQDRSEADFGDLVMGAK